MDTGEVKLQCRPQASANHMWPGEHIWSLSIGLWWAERAGLLHPCYYHLVDVGHPRDRASPCLRELFVAEADSEGADSIPSHRGNDISCPHKLTTGVIPVSSVGWFTLQDSLLLHAIAAQSWLWPLTISTAQCLKPLAISFLSGWKAYPRSSWKK